MNGAEFNEDGTQAVTSSWDGTARVWDTETGDPLAVFQGHRGALSQAVFSPQGDRVLTAGDDETARIWNVATEAEVAVFRGHEEAISFAEFSHDGGLAVTAGGDDRTARVWDTKTGEEYAQLRHDDLGQHGSLQPQRRARRHGQRRQDDPGLGSPKRSTARRVPES